LLQMGESLGMPLSRPMPTVGAGCHELRIRDEHTSWRVIYHIATDAIVILEVFGKKTARTPLVAIRVAKKRLRDYLQAKGD